MRSKISSTKNYKLLFSSIQKFNQKYNCDFKLHLVGKGLNENNKKLVKNLIKLKFMKKQFFMTSLIQ